MKKLLLLSVVMLLSMAAASSSFAQRFGLKGGVNISSMSMEGVKNYVGYQGGITCQIDLPLWFTIQPDLIFHVKGGVVEDIRSAVGLGYLEIPVNIQWGPRLFNKKVRVFGQASPYVGYALSKDIVDPQGNKYGWANINRFEYGAAAGLGVQFWFLQLTAQYNWSFGKLVNSNLAEESFKSMFSESNFDGYTVTLAILF